MPVDISLVPSICSQFRVASQDKTTSKVDSLLARISPLVISINLDHHQEAIPMDHHQVDLVVVVTITMDHHQVAISIMDNLVITLDPQLVITLDYHHQGTTMDHHQVAILTMDNHHHHHHHKVIIHMLNLDHQVVNRIIHTILIMVHHLHNNSNRVLILMVNNHLTIWV